MSPNLMKKQTHTNLGLAWTIPLKQQKQLHHKTNKQKDDLEANFYAFWRQQI